MNFGFFGIDAVENSKLVVVTEAEFPPRSKDCRADQKPSIACFNIRLVGELIFNQMANKGVMFPLDSLNLTDEFGIVQERAQAWNN